MKSFYSFASLAVTALCSEDLGPWSYSYDEFANRDVKTLFDYTDNEIGSGLVWKLYTYTALEYDTGNEYFRMEHELTADIKATDEVTFNVAFTSESDPWTNKMVISDDGVICKVVQNTMNTLLWDQTSEDIYYKCTDATTCIHQAISPTTAFEQGADDSTGADWTNPLADDDEDAPYCTAHTDTTYACQKIKCITQRLLATEDDLDFNFAPTSTATDTMVIKPGRALLGINASGCSSSTCTYLPTGIYSDEGTTFSIKVRQGAASLFTGLVGAFTAATLLAF